MYYLQSRYYNPTLGRFLNADNYPTTGQGLSGNNMFAYCGNNPVIRVDNGGTFWETAFDLISLGASIAEVVANPADPWAWAGLVGDALDLVPFVTGVGEVTRAVKAADKISDIADVADDVHDAKKVVSSTKNARRNAVKKAWKNEVENVKHGGHGISRSWSIDEADELLSKGKVSGYYGHHMKSVQGYPELAGDPTNIQFLTRNEHFAAHGGNWRNITHGRYIP